MFDFPTAVAVAGAATSILIAGTGSAIGMGVAGLSGAGVIAEKPDLFGKVLILQALPGTQVIYGFLGAILILINIGILGGETVELAVAWQYFFASLPVAFTGLFSGMYQGRVSAAGIQAIAKNPGVLGNAMVLSAMVETVAIFGLLVTLLLVTSI